MYNEYVCTFNQAKRNVFDNRERWLFLLILQKHLIISFSPNQSAFLLLIMLKQIKAFSPAGEYKVSNLDGCHLA